MSAYEIYLLLHIISVIAWLGGSILLQVFGRRAAASDAGRQLSFAQDMEAAGKLFNVAGISALVWGILMVIESPLFDWDQAWISIGFLGIALGAGLGMAFYAPNTRRLIGQLESGDSGATATMQRIMVVARIELVLLLVVVWAMVAKPGL